METEFVDVETRDEFVDLTFWLEDGTILHIEEQTELTPDDLIRFAHYDLRIYKRHQVNIHTIVLSPASIRQSGKRNIDTGSLQYSVTHLVIHGRNADELLERIQKEISEGRPIHELELIFIPLMESRLSVKELLLETIKLEKEINNESIRNKVIALTLVMTNKLVGPEVMESIWEEIKMLKIVKFAEEKGIEKGREQGMKQGLVKGIEKGREQGLVQGLVQGQEQGRIEEKRSLVERLLVKKFGLVPQDILEQIPKMNAATLDLISIEIFDMQRIEDLQRYIVRKDPN